MSGEAVPPSSATEYMCEGLRLSQDNLRHLGELRQRQEKVLAEALQLQQEMNDFKTSFTEQINNVILRTPLTVKPRKMKVDLDATEETGELENLPSPLKPQLSDRDAVRSSDGSGSVEKAEIGQEEQSELLGSNGEENMTI